MIGDRGCLVDHLDHEPGTVDGGSVSGQKGGILQASNLPGLCFAANSRECMVSKGNSSRSGKPANALEEGSQRLLVQSNEALAGLAPDAFAILAQPQLHPLRIPRVHLTCH